MTYLPSLPKNAVLLHPSPLARKIKNHVAFWNGVQIDSGMVLRDRVAGTRPQSAPGGTSPGAAG
jgi:hypothetical protein